MKRKFLIILFSILCVCIIGAGFVSCKKDTVTESRYTLSGGEEIPASIEAEVGSLCIIPKVVNGDGAELTFEVKAKDNTVVEINNGKFRAVVLGGYTISYIDNETVAVTIVVNVKDSSAPMIIVNAPEGMTVIYNSTVNIPTCKVSDSSGENITAEISVKDKDGKDVTVKDNTFVASVLGTYVVTYKATDASGNTATKTLGINCEIADLLNGFETLSDVGYFADAHEKELNTEYASTGNGVKITDTSTENYTYRSLYVPLKLDGQSISLKQLLKYEKVQLTVYASESNELGLANGTFSITAGQNIMVFTKEQIQAGLKFTKGQYSETEGFLLNLRYGTNGFWMVFDDFIGIYPRDYVPTQPAEITVNGVDGMPVLFGSEVTLPTATAVADGKDLEYTVTVKDKTGATVELNGNKFTADVVGPYTAEYEITTVGYEGYATIGFVCRYGTLFNDFESSDCVTYAKDADTTATRQTVDTFGGKGVKITALTDFAYDQVRLPIKDDGNFVTARSFAKYDKLVFVVYVGNDLKLCTANANEQYDIRKGWNAVTFSVANFVAAGNFDENANGIYLCVHGLKTGKDIIFDGIYGLRVENYEPPVAGKVNINAVNGSVIIKDKEIFVPSCTVEDSDGNALDYEVVIKDANGETVDINGDKFIPSVLGAYELTYTITSDGYSGSERIVLQCKKAQLLNSFDSLSDLPYVINIDTTKLAEVVKTYDGNGVKASAPNGMSWAQIQVGAKDKNGFISWKNFRKFAKIQFVVYSSSSATFGTATFSESVGVSEGWNIVELGMSAIVAAGNFREDANGFYLCVNGLGENEYLIFDSFYGIYADDYEPDVGVEVEIDSADGLTAIIGNEYALPAYKAEHDGKILECGIIVTDGAGNAVEIKDGKFAVSALGTYTITYKIITEGYEGENSISVIAKKGNVLNNFDKAADMTYIAVSATTEIVDALSGKAMKITANAAFSWTRVSFPMMENGSYLTVNNLKKYEKIRFIVYAKSSVYICTANNNAGYTLTDGWNTIDFVPSDIIAATGFEENANGYYMCVNGLGTGESLMLYAAYGIYADDYVPTKNGELRINSIDGLIALYGNEYVIPSYTAVDADGESLDCSVTVTDNNGMVVAVNDGKFKANVLGKYTLNYKITSKGYEGEASVAVNCKKGNLLNNFDKAADMTYIAVSATTEIVEALSSKAMKITANTAFSWTRVSFPVTENGVYLTVENLKKYDKIRFVIYCSTDAVYTCTANNNEGYTLSAGWNIVEFAPDNIIAATGFEENANGYYLCVNNVPQGGYISMYSAEGVYVDDFAA